MNVTTGYVPRPGQTDIHLKLKRFNVLNVHRRWGKTVLCINHILHHLLKCSLKNPQAAYIAQNYASAERIVWQYFKDSAAQIPAIKTNESKLLLSIPRPHMKDVVKIQLLGSEKYDSIRGLYFDWVVFDEFAFSQPNAWTEVVRPTLADRPGSAILISTPNGRNHFYDIYQNAERLMKEPDSEWFATTIRASESKVIADKELKSIRDAIGEEAYQQEFECSFFSRVKGAYYKDAIEKLRGLNQIRDFPIDVAHPVNVAFDLGIGDSTALWFYQLVNREIHVIDYYEASGLSLPEYVKIIRDKPYVLGEVVLPHDAKVRELGTGLSRLETLRNLGMSNITVLPRLPVDDGISAVRLALPRCFFHESNTVRGLECLYSYCKQYNDKMQVFVNKPLHNWASHGADAFRYLALSLERLDPAKRNQQQPRSSVSDYDVLGGMGYG